MKLLFTVLLLSAIAFAKRSGVEQLQGLVTRVLPQAIEMKNGNVTMIVPIELLHGQVVRKNQFLTLLVADKDLKLIKLR